MLEILAAGVGTTVQDRGRRGWAHLGIGRAGAADLPSHDLANRLVGNLPGAATLETSGGLRLRVLQPVVLAVTGAIAPWTVDGGPPLGNGLAQAFAAGAHLSCATPSFGLRAYVAVRGGVDVPAVLGSRSRDTLGGIGPELPAVLPVGADPGGSLPAELVPPRHWPAEVDVVPGPRSDWFDAGAWEMLTTIRWRVSAATSRVGARLEGPALVRLRAGELPSEGLVEGAVQVPPGGQPIVMLADHPVTGGYPVIAVVRGDHLDRVAQAPPGAMLSFRSGRP